MPSGEHTHPDIDERLDGQREALGSLITTQNEHGAKLEAHQQAHEGTAGALEAQGQVNEANRESLEDLDARVRALEEDLGQPPGTIEPPKKPGKPKPPTDPPGWGEHPPGSLPPPVDAPRLKVYDAAGLGPPWERAVIAYGNVIESPDRMTWDRDRMAAWLDGAYQSSPPDGYAGPILLDWEGPALKALYDGDDAVVDEYQSLIQTCAEAFPKARVGVYHVAPERRLYSVDQEWRDRAHEVVNALVEFGLGCLAPSCYCFNDIEANVEAHQRMLELAFEIRAEHGGTTLQVIPFIWRRRHGNGGKGDLSHVLLTSDEWDHVLAGMMEAGVTRLVVWGNMSSQYASAYRTKDGGTAWNWAPESGEGDILRREIAREVGAHFATAQPPAHDDPGNPIPAEQLDPTAEAIIDNTERRLVAAGGE